MPIEHSRRSGFDPIRSQTVPELVVQHVRDAILAGKLRPGERLVEQKLAAEFGVGQPTIREALKDLEHLGFVRKKQNRGTYVTEFTREDIRKNLELRIALEALSMAGAARNMTDKEASVLRGLIDQMDAAASAFDLPTFHKTDTLFHQRIWNLCGNEYLTAALERTVFSLFAFALLERKPSDEVMRHVSQQHLEILTALLTRDARQARACFVHSTVQFWQKYHHIEILDVGEEALRA